MNNETKRPLPTVEMEGEIARGLFEERNGDSLFRDLRAIEGSLKMHDQDVTRGMQNENPEKFRWRVNPITAARLRKERKVVEAQIQALIDECNAEAAKLVAQMQTAGPETEPAAPASTSPTPEPRSATAGTATPTPETEPTLEVTHRQPEESEAIPKA